eukprot:CAMPEP_0182863626 /NCGR_PEP_ID=MMETSP0034_2-20130328/6754_1 /TAXON_ID=156128 /ORGANISM="Nephroselmis pyriformis, Strain CCMP717" /LENGTH=144 /DNA_ID=CAMNT_0024995863 /DNA_START=51 /DNA_END=483 /DNA_ORIENTATION=+
MEAAAEGEHGVGDVGGHPVGVELDLGLAVHKHSAVALGGHGKRDVVPALDRHVLVTRPPASGAVFIALDVYEVTIRVVVHGKALGHAEIFANPFEGTKLAVLKKVAGGATVSADHINGALVGGGGDDVGDELLDRLRLEKLGEE